MKCKSIINNFVIVLNTCIPNIKTIGVNNTEYLCVNDFKYFIDFNEKILKNVRHKFYYFSIFFSIKVLIQELTVMIVLNLKLCNVGHSNHFMNNKCSVFSFILFLLRLKFVKS